VAKKQQAAETKGLLKPNKAKKKKKKKKKSKKGK